MISPFELKDLRKSSLDLVRIVVDMPYLPEKRARNMDFSAEYLYLERLRLNAIEKGIFQSFDASNIHLSDEQ